MVRTKDRNNFINIIINKIELAKNFHQRVALTITAKTILHCAVLKFYIRRRYERLYLCIRLDKAKLGNVTERHNLIKDFKLLFPEVVIDGTQGHYKGIVIEITDSTREVIYNILKFISILAHPNDYYCKDTKIYKSFWNYTHSSKIPIHFQITNSLFSQLTNQEIIRTLQEINPYDRNNV